MREAARALDDVSDHLGEVLRRADELLADWSRFGAQVRVQVERDTAAIGEVVEGAIARAGTAGIDRAIGDRLRALTIELEKLEQRARAASRAAAEQRDADRRILWGVVAGIVLANALLVVLILRRPEAPPVAEPIRIDPPPAAVAQPPEGAVAPTMPTTTDPSQVGAPAAGAAGAGGAASPASGTATPAGAAQTGASGGRTAGTAGPNAGTAGAPSTAPASASGGPSGVAGGQSAVAGGPNAGGAAAAGAAIKPAAGSGAQGGARPADGTKAMPIALPPKPGPAHHKKLP